MKTLFLLLFSVFLTTPTFGEESAPEGMVLISKGIFQMGSKKSMLELRPHDLFNTDRHTLGPENPAHEVYLDGFYIDIYEVTNDAYAKYVKETGGKKPMGWNSSDFREPQQPVVGIGWKEAVKFCKWQNKRLPTEAEWEKAARGKRPVKYPWGNTPPDSSKLNYNEDIKKTTAVGSFETGKSDYGVYDLSGNVAEWVNDWHYPEYYLFSPKKNPPGPEKGQYKIIRGGSWRHNAEDVNLTYRNATTPVNRSTSIGFRCAQRAAEGK
jgi:formylglycine-generating enzyme required for sulfatase activity